MNTYEDELVLDPFMGSGTTAVAARRTGRHYVGYDTDAHYVAAATSRVAAEHRRQQVRLGSRPGAHGDPVEQGWAAKDLAVAMLEQAGYVDIVDGDRIVPGVEPTLAEIGRAHV